MCNSQYRESCFLHDVDTLNLTNIIKWLKPVHTVSETSYNKLIWSLLTSLIKEVISKGDFCRSNF